MFDKIHIYTGVLLGLIYMGAWILNGVGNYNFSLDPLIILYVAVAGRDVAGYTVNSLFNSKRGEAPGK